MMIFDKLFKKKEEEPQKRAEKELELSKLTEWIDQEKNELDEDVIEFSDTLERINESFSEMESVVIELENKELEEEVIKRLENITLTSKRKFCENMLIVLRKIPHKKPKTCQDLIDYIDNVEMIINNINKTHQTHGKYLGIVFQGYLKRIGKELKTIVTLNNILKKQAQNTLNEWEEIDEIKNIYEEYLLLDAESAEKSISSIESRIAKEKKDIEVLESKKKEYFSSSKYLEHGKLKEKISLLEEREHGLNLAIYEYFGPIKRVLKKLQKKASDGKYSMRSVNMLGDYIEYPVRTVLEDTDDLKHTKDMMNELRDAIEKGVIDEKKGKLEKANKISKRIISGDLDDLKTEYRETWKELEEYKIKFESFSMEELNYIERDISQHAHKVNSLEDDLNSKNNLLKDINDKSKKYKSRLKKKINDLYPEITLNL